MTARDKLIWRLLWIPFSAAVLFFLLSGIFRDVNNILNILAEDGYGLAIPFEFRERLVLALSVFASLAHLILELAAFSKGRSFGSRVLAHLRYGPVMIHVLALATVIAFDAVMIEVSRQQIRNYVYSASTIVDKPEFGSLHNNDRGWCGNGWSATYEYLYYPTASAGMSDPDPAVRTRSFLASAQVRDLLNGSPRFRLDTQAACRDESELVRQTVENHLSGSKTSCEKILTSAGK